MLIAWTACLVPEDDASHEGGRLRWLACRKVRYSGHTGERQSAGVLAQLGQVGDVGCRWLDATASGFLLEEVEGSFCARMPYIPVLVTAPTVQCGMRGSPRGWVQ